MLEISNDGAMDQLATARNGPLEISSNDSADVVEAAAGDEIQPVTFELDHEVRDGKYATAQWESEFSSRNQLLAAIEREKAEERAELEALEGLTPEAEAERQATLAAMQAEPEAEGEQQQPTGELTEAELAQVREQAVRDAIATGRRAAGLDAQMLETEYAAAQAQVQAEFQKKLTWVRSQHSDYDAVMAELARNDVPLSQAKSEALMTVGGPELVYRIAKSPAKQLELRNLNDNVAVATIGKWAAELNAKPQPARQRSKLLAPMRAVSGSIRSSVPMDELPYAEYRAAREREIRVRRGR
jgi:hypothetical protein